MKIAGVVENMISEEFGSGGGAELAKELGVPLLASIPLKKEMREATDKGIPAIEIDAGTAEKFSIIAEALR